MAAPFEFQINFGGNFPTALNPLNKSLVETDKNLDKAGKGLKLFEAELGKVDGAAGGFGLHLSAIAKDTGSLFTFNLAQAAGVAVEAVEKVVGKIIDLGKEIVKTSAEAQDLDLAIELDVGKAQAEAISDLADSFANTRFDDDAIKTALLPILEQGMKDETLLADIATAASDISARRKSGVAGMTAAVGAFQRIAFKGEVDGRALRELAIGEADYFKDLGHVLGVTAKKAEEQTKAGKVAKDVLLKVALHQVAEREGGALGTAALAAGKTLGGTLERLGNLWPNLLKQLADTPGIKMLQEVLDNFITVMSGEQGKQLMTDIGQGIHDVAKEVIGFLTGPDGLKTMVSTVKGLIDFLKSAWGVLKGIVDVVAGGAKAFKEFALMYIPGARLLSDDKLGTSSLGNLWESAKQTGRGVGKIFSSIGGGEAAAEVPKMAAGGIVTRPTLALIGEAGPEAVVPLGSMGGGVQLVVSEGAMQINVQVGAGADLGAIIEAIKQALRAQWEQLLAEARASLAGAAP